jgi:excisionase family DNA binding protein
MPRRTLEELRDGPAVLTIAEAAEALGLSKRAVYAAARRGAIPTVRIGPRNIVVPTAKLLELLGDNHEEAS